MSESTHNIVCPPIDLEPAVRPRRGVPLRLVRRVSGHLDPGHLRHPDPPRPVLPQPPSLPLTLAALSVVTVGALLPATPLAHTLGFDPLTGGFFAALTGMVIIYLLLIEVGKRHFYRAARVTITTERRPYNRTRHLVPQHEQLHVFRGLTTATLHQQPEHRPRKRIHDRQQHRNDHAEPRLLSPTGRHIS